MVLHLLSESCVSSTVEERVIEEAARVLYEELVKESLYGPIDKLAYATSFTGLLVALYEISRCMKKPENRGKLEPIVRAIVADSSRSECLEEALRLARALASKSLTFVS